MAVPVIETVRHTYRPRHGAGAQGALRTGWTWRRFPANEQVHQQKAGNRPTLCSLSEQLTRARRAIPWLCAGSRVAQEQTLRTYAMALNHSFTVTGRGRPKFTA
jgi:putative transposase